MSARIFRDQSGRSARRRSHGAVRGMNIGKAEESRFTAPSVLAAPASPAPGIETPSTRSAKLRTLQVTRPRPCCAAVAPNSLSIAGTRRPAAAIRHPQQSPTRLSTGKLRPLKNGGNSISSQSSSALRRSDAARLSTPLRNSPSVNALRKRAEAGRRTHHSTRPRLGVLRPFAFGESDQLRKTRSCLQHLPCSPLRLHGRPTIARIAASTRPKPILSCSRRRFLRSRLSRRSS